MASRRPAANSVPCKNKGTVLEPESLPFVEVLLSRKICIETILLRVALRCAWSVFQWHAETPLLVDTFSCRVGTFGFAPIQASGGIPAVSDSWSAQQIWAVNQRDGPDHLGFVVNQVMAVQCLLSCVGVWLAVFYIDCTPATLGAPRVYQPVASEPESPKAPPSGETT